LRDYANPFELRGKRRAGRGTGQTGLALRSFAPAGANVTATDRGTENEIGEAMLHSGSGHKAELGGHRENVFLGQD